MSQDNGNSDSLAKGYSARATKSQRWRRLILIIATVVAVVGLALGLGLGLGLRKGDEDDDDTSDLGEPDKGVDRTVKWAPAVGDMWQILLLKPIDLSTSLEPNVSIYDLDLFDNDAEVFQELHNKGKKVICYFSAGSWEIWRDDEDQFDDSDLGSIMAERVKLASDKGCDAIDPDNV
ncbi:hypothetical protein SAPIO_CDS7908 [Scedosporium apiospermum]|uniref:alpha-galactosidase n=1 Tax=Pseudallescheria apiosperma TaxID=563466 RepID=A0A084G0P6_PSEDA|nr:uncharacterized protein SAPIO_CDS7908 [Scedosporium apiospermum]KEZ40908.1 hypothetical protein SAPIO_CDS7908 [Scedosporium apiospermum]